jgi:hypothetical protein
MSQQLELFREQKLYRLIPCKTKKSRLEASGVALVDDQTALVVFDNLNQIARIDLSLEPSERNALLPAPSVGLGFEDIAIDERHGRAFCLIESLEDVDGRLRGFVAEYDPEGHFVRCTRLHTTFEKENKGFEGLEHVWLGNEERLYALCEGNHGKGRAASGRVDVFARSADGSWEASHSIALPRKAAFDDYAALSYRFGQIAVVSQESARLWVARIDEKEGAVVKGSGVVYRFPSKRYGNVEGIAWLTPNTLVAVSDRTSADQPANRAEKDQSIHLFRIPSEDANEEGSN